MTVGSLIDGRSNSVSAGVPFQACGGLIEHVLHALELAQPHGQKPVEAGDGARRQAQPRSALLGRLDVLPVELGIAVGAGGDDHEVDALVQDGLAPVAHRLLARRLDDDVGLELEQRLQRLDDRHLAADLLLRLLGAARADQDAYDVDVGLLLAEDVEQGLADGAIADQGDLEPLLPGHAVPPRIPEKRRTIARARRPCDHGGARL